MADGDSPNKNPLYIAFSQGVFFLFVCGLYQTGIWIGSYHWCFISPVLIYCVINKVPTPINTTLPSMLILYVGLCIIYQGMMGIEPRLMCYIHLYISAWGVCQVGMWLKKEQSNYGVCFLICCGVFRVVISIRQSNPGPEITEACPTYNYALAGTISEDLERDFADLLHAQHLVHRPVVGAIQSHLADPDPPKALVLSFHGPTGVGKNFVSNIIADNLFERKRGSEFVHVIIGPHHFPHSFSQGLYSQLLHSWISGNVSSCERSMFIFDEVDKFPPGLIDTIKGYLGYYPKIDGVVYRKTIFIFISNTGGEAFKRYVFDQRTRLRESLTMKELEEVTFAAAYSEDGGLQKAQLLDKHLVSVFVPFLPLERAHVRLCVQDDLRCKGYPVTEYIVESVLQEMSFFPPNVLGEDDVQFSETGCKRVADKVDMIAYERRLKRRK